MSVEAGKAAGLWMRGGSTVPERDPDKDSEGDEADEGGADDDSDVRRGGCVREGEGDPADRMERRGGDERARAHKEEDQQAEQTEGLRLRRRRGHSSDKTTLSLAHERAVLYAGRDVYEERQSKRDQCELGRERRGGARPLRPPRFVHDVCWTRRGQTLLATRVCTTAELTYRHYTLWPMCSFPPVRHRLPPRSLPARTSPPPSGQGHLCCSRLDLEDSPLGQGSSRSV